MTSRNPPDTDPSEWDEVLHLLADETRMHILVTLVHTGDDIGHGSLTYSALKSAVGIADNGTFNYHLNKLLGHFVEKEDDEYRVRYPGLLAYRALIAGSFTTGYETTSFELRTDCHECDTTLRARYTEDYAFYVDCPACSSTFTAVQLPPPGFDSWSDDHLLRAVNQRMRHDISSLAKGVCPWCAADTTTILNRASEDVLPDDEQPRTVYVTHVCNVCRTGYHTTIGETLLSHPAIVSFCYEHGIDLTETPAWEFEFVVTDHYTEVVSENPWRIALTVPLDDEHLRVTVDEEVSVRSIERFDPSERPAETPFPPPNRK